MRVVCAYTHLHPATDEALRRYALDAERVDVSSDDEAYWRLIRDLWAAQEDFVLIEHDVEVDDNILAAFETCPELWCANASAPWPTMDVTPAKPFAHIRPEGRRREFMAEQNRRRANRNGGPLPPFVDPKPLPRVLDLRDCVSALQCSRFRRELMAAQPNVVNEIPSEHRIWTWVSYGLLRRLTLQVHPHLAVPTVHHHAENKQAIDGVARG